MAPSNMYPKVLIELFEVIARPLPIIFERLLTKHKFPMIEKK